MYNNTLQCRMPALREYGKRKATDMLEFEEYKVKLNNRRPELLSLREAMRLEDARGEIEKLQAESTEEGYWNDVERSQKAQRRLRPLQIKCESFRKLETAWDDMMVICEMALEENDESMLPELVDGYATR